MLPEQMLWPGRTHSGEGVLERLPEEVAAWGAPGLIVHGGAVVANGRLERLLALFPAAARPRTWRYGGGEPTLAVAEELRTFMRNDRPAWVAAIGGGSVLDLAKAAAGLIDAPESFAAYQLGAPIPPATLPFVAVPTTAGTGSEATVNSVFTNPERELKRAIRHPSFMPHMALLDPTLLHGCPQPILAAAGMDAFTQAYESYVSRYATPFTQAISALAMQGLATALPAFYDGDLTAGTRLLEGSYLAGFALCHARLGIVHGLAHPLGARWHASHGLTCAICLPIALRYNAEASIPQRRNLEALLGAPIEEVVDGLMDRFKLVSPFKGAPLRDVEAIVEETLGATGATGANPRTVTADDVRMLLGEIF